MMEYTDRHFRHLVRLISNRTLLYTEMVAANSLAYERRHHMESYINDHPDATSEQVRRHYNDEYLRRFLRQGSMEPYEGPSVLQLGGSDPIVMKEAAETVMDMTQRGYCDYTAINLNCGCPSPKVAGKGCFGAALMDDPHLVAKLTQALHDGCDEKLPISVKCRIGTDTHQPFTKMGYQQRQPKEEELEYQKLCHFIETVARNGIVTDFGVHARIAVLSKSFSPADNRKIPPLKYDMVRRLVQEYPEFTFTLNGGIDTLSQAQEQLDQCPNLRGVMIGRAWAADPWSFAMADHVLYGDDVPTKTRLDILQEYGRHADHEEQSIDDPVKIRRFLIKAITTLFAGESNAKKYRIALDEIAGIPKRLQQQGQSCTVGQPPLSELILNVAHTHLSEEVLLRSPQESYERKLWEEEKTKRDRPTIMIVTAGANNTNNDGNNINTENAIGRSDAVAEWQSDRQQEKEQQGDQNDGGGTAAGAYEAALAGDESSPFAIVATTPQS
ncbi:tRNA-U16,U17-dihydrouridine synthase [Nitzschia inconspicua]|uniref:tRNA-U16,U17-dihydrouridine synthase n=1 Tax=Nitzschia inconspicua TaxID=303405 RepID=A0A9K3M5K4_9STRA|nr:tRNA-U16,U17-dihydrouridine synthase [Nitzschia inconspicua]